MTNNKPELLSPAGSFMSAYYAFKAGADAVYLGLRDYSARKTAQNFNDKELLKIKKIAEERNKKIYITINTVIRESELENLIVDLQFLNKLDINAIIVQDFGIIELLRNHYPHIPIHASTQTAIHNNYGIEKAIDLGIKRIILPRELSFKKINDFKRRYKDIEFEVFIHGSLCYSYSGLCLSSGLLNDRSGNRGECTQPCRNAYSYNIEKGNFFSCKDLFLGSLVKKLMDINVDSFKIEGRQKNPEYIYNIVKLYRYIIDEKGKPKGPHYEDLIQNSGFVYSRERTKGYVFRKKNDKIITDKYARNIGSPIGKVRKKLNDSFFFKTKSDIIINDVLLFFLNKFEKTPYKMPVRSMEINNRRVSFAGKNTFIKIYSDKIPENGQEIFKAYSKDLELEGISHRTFNAFRIKIPAEIIFFKKQNHMIGIDFLIDNEIYSIESPLIIEKSGKHINIEERMQELFSKPSDSLYEIKISKIRNETSLNHNEIFLPESMLKNINRMSYRFLEKIDKEIDIKKVSLIMKTLNEVEKLNSNNSLNFNDQEFIKFISRRENINIKNNIIPFYTGNNINPGTLASFGIYYFIPLNPIVYNNDHYKKIINFIKQNPDKHVFLGINNIHHLKFMESLECYENVYSFIDFFFYTANRFTLYNESIAHAKVMFAYYWIEGKSKDFEHLKNLVDMPIFKIEPSFPVPLFLHEGSFIRESLKMNFKKKENGKNIKITDKDKDYTVYEKNGFSYVFKGRLLL